MTKDGVKSLASLVGSEIQVLNRYHGWENATVEEFGVQPLKKLTITNSGNKKEIFVTGNHRWFVRENNGFV